ncbi:MAG: SGNH/GDSL hydrolase family protein [Candidatus Thalassarchaeaceae archaeon]
MSSLTTAVTAQEDSSEDEYFDFHTIASLGDSTLGSDPTGYRGPFASIHAANLMGLDYYEGAVGGDRSWTLIEAGRHTTIAENYSEGTLVTIMIGAWDFIDSDAQIVKGDYSFISNLEENMTIILDTLTDSNIDVLAWTLPNMSFLPFLTQIFPTEKHEYFTEASIQWADTLNRLADSYGDNVQVFDLLNASDDLLQNQEARTISGNEVVAPPVMCDKNCIMIDSLHPTSVGQGLLANYMMEAINEKFPASTGDYSLLSQDELLSLADFNSSSEEAVKLTIEGDLTEACFDWTSTGYRDMYITITIDGEDVEVPSYVGFNTEQCSQSTHVMYTGSRVINVVTDITNDLTLNHFFDIWGKNLSSTQIMDYQVDEGDSLILIVDLVQYEGDWENIPVEGAISIEIIYTSAPTAVSSSEDGDSVPGFPAIIALASILGAIVVSRKEE